MADTRKSASSSPAGLDGHDRGATIIASALLDEGVRSHLTWLQKSRLPRLSSRAAVQEDVDGIGLRSCRRRTDALPACVSTLLGSMAPAPWWFGCCIIPDPTSPS